MIIILLVIVIIVIAVVVVVAKIIITIIITIITIIIILLLLILIIYLHDVAVVDLHDTHQWLRSAGLIKTETEGFIVAAQDQSFFTRNFQANILYNGADPRCRFCNTNTESVDHLISGCTILAPNQYTNRHNRVGQYIHWKICNHYNIETPNKWYEHKPLPVVDTPEVTILWDFSIGTDKTIQANRPDIVIKHKKKQNVSIDRYECAMR